VRRRHGKTALVSIELRTATEDDLPAMFASDSRAFGFTYEQQDIDDRRTIIDPERFHLAIDGGKIVGVAGAFAFEMTVPGGASLPTGGVTWVHVATTHRRQGLLTRLMGAAHDDLRARGEPLAALGASESGIYGRFGYGLATMGRSTRIERHRAAFRDDAPIGGGVRFIDVDEARDVLPKLWDRFRRQRAGEVTISDGWWTFYETVWRKPEDGWTTAMILVHDDGYLAYRLKEEWDGGFTKTALQVEDNVWCTPEAHATLWKTVVSTDLVATITSNLHALDDPLPMWLVDPRALRTSSLTDGVWVNLLDPVTALRARRYDVADRLVLQVVDGPRLELDAGPDGASVRPSRRRADVTLAPAELASLLMGGVRATALGRGGRIDEHTAGALRRADFLFDVTPLPFCSTHF
jgi:predicted acetyltransferase